MRYMGLFITFEGGEATGKTSQARQLWDRLRVEGYVCSLVREPGGTALGEKLRPLLKGHTPPTPIAELFLFSAARAELVTRHIWPELDRGSIVIADRYVHSTIAYQGYGYEGRKGGPTQKQIQAVNLIATKDVMPDLTILLDMEPEEALKRIAALAPELSMEENAGQGGRVDKEGRKFEDENITFHKRVREGYLKQARRDPDRWLVVDASRAPDIVSSEIWERVVPLLPKTMTHISESQGTLENRRLI